jgi:hypothetical protein
MSPVVIKNVLKPLNTPQQRAEYYALCVEKSN